MADQVGAGIFEALGPVRGGTAVSDVATRMLDLFTSGALTPGTRLPPERRLAESLGVGRSAVREALAALEILGIVTVRPGSGTYLRGTTSELLPQTLRWGLLIGERSTAELVELRSGLEIYVARLAARRLDAAGLEALGRTLGEMRESLPHLDGFAQADLDFHRMLSEGAENSMLLDQLAVTRSLLRVYEDRQVQGEQEARVALEEHESIYTAMAHGDPDGAAAAMATHMATAAARVSSLS